MNWTAHAQGRGEILVQFSRLVMRGGWPSIDRRPEYQRYGWKIGQAVFRIVNDDFTNGAYADALRKAFPTVVINRRWVFLDRNDYALIKLAAS